MSLCVCARWMEVYERKGRGIMIDKKKEGWRNIPIARHRITPLNSINGKRGEGCSQHKKMERNWLFVFVWMIMNYLPFTNV